MPGNDFLIARAAAKRGVIGHVTTDTPIAFRLRYVGTGTVTSVTVTTATNIVMITSDGGTDTYAFATYTTMGALVDAINGDGIFEARLLDTLRSDATDGSELVDGAISSTTVLNGTVSQTVWDALVDTSTAFHFSYRLTPDRVFDRPKGTKRIHLVEFKYAINMGTAAEDSVQVYDIYKGTETKIYSALSVDTTATTVNWASGEAYITADENHELLVRVKDAAQLDDATSNYLTVNGFIE